ncbi:CNBP [Mytilus edulis]|uniref:CNBP n=1 Tax=Mytilus edulis TaxID=6550 RepID=A0A8S3RWU0_MYTED|nr:CNBP [Mytilus edulis]
MSRVSRQLSIHFYTKGFKGIKHDEILTEISKQIHINNVGSIQITEKECIVSLKDVESKDTLVVNGITLRNRSVNFLDVEKSITHVTIKDAPYELDDRYIVAQMIRFGQIVPGSVKRGYIKGTEIENGARYIDILNCDPVLPLRTSLGRFEVRLFADNNRTPCFHCKLIGHSSYQCKDRPKIMNERRCYNCAAIGHLANACPNEAYCSYCNINGHSRRDCESFKQDQENQGYSKHGPEIIEGRQETKLDAHSDTHSVCDNDTFSESGKNDTTDTLNVLIGASNCTRLGETDENLLNASKSGANFENFTQILDIAVQKTDSFKVDKVAICLGTNDISKHKDDSDQINLLVTKAVAQVKSAYPESHVGLCSIIPRKGNSAQINRLNQSATSVNKFIRKLCAREDNVDYVDLEKLFYKNGTIIRSMFDKADNSGVHINTEGAQNINRKLDDFFHSPKPCVQELHTPMDPKRKRSDGTTTPTSADRMSKRSNTEPKKA